MSNGKQAKKDFKHFITTTYFKPIPKMNAISTIPNLLKPMCSNLNNKHFFENVFLEGKRIFVNLIDGKLTFNTNSSRKNTVVHNIELFDLKARLVKRIQGKNANSTRSTNLSFLPQGTYLMIVTDLFGKSYYDEWTKEN